MTDWEEKHPDDRAGNHLHLTGYPSNMDDCSHLALVWGLPGLRGAQVRRSEAKREFAHARRNAYLYFGTPEQAAAEALRRANRQIADVLDKTADRAKRA